MLTYSYKIKTTSNKEEIEVNDFYISSDLSYISGTTSPKNSFDVGDKLTVNTDYYPKPMLVKVTGCDTVKRNGYITYYKDLPIKLALYSDYSSGHFESPLVKFIELDGNTYFQNMNNVLYTTFLVNGELFSANNNEVLSIVSNGIGMKSILELVSQAITDLGSTTKVDEGFTSTSSKELLNGLKAFQKASLEASKNG